MSVIRPFQEIHVFVNRVPAAAAPGAYLVELFPWMFYIPERYASVNYWLSSHPLRLNARFAKWKQEGMEHYRQHAATSVFRNIVS